VKSTLATTRPRSAGTSAIPESMMATPTPSPVTPATAPKPSHAWSAPIATFVIAICDRRT
jgi:hypothetical protein